jgi:hypothetical protein
MEKKLIGIIIGIFIIIGSLVFLFLSSNDKELGVSPSNQLEDCNSIYFNGDDKVNLVFFSTSDEAKIYSDSLFEVEPLKKEDFNVYNIEYFPGCSLYEDIALFCYTPGLIEKSSSCPNDFVIVLEEKDRIIRSSSYMNVISINTRHQESVFAHEFGHAFANLAEEYVPAKLPRKSRNCVQSCENFEISDG